MLHPPTAQGQFRCHLGGRMWTAVGGGWPLFGGLAKVYLSLGPEEIRERLQEHGLGKVGDGALLWGGEC